MAESPLGRATVKKDHPKGGPFMKTALLAVVVCLAAHPAILAAAVKPVPFMYREDFSSNELNAWASYPLWQDTAYDPNIRPDRLVPGDPNISLVERVTPYSPGDAYGGAQKLLDFRLAPGTAVRLRVYLKTQLRAEFVKVRLAAGPLGALDVTVPGPATNAWVAVTARYEDFVKESPGLAGREAPVSAVAVLAKFLDADPAVPLYFGLDDVAVDGIRDPDFSFVEPRMLKLAEWKPFIPAGHFKRGDGLRLSGSWPFAARRTTLEISAFSARDKVLLRADLRRAAGAWLADGLRLDLPEGLYIGRVAALEGRTRLAESEFTIYIAPRPAAHPRLWFDAAGLKAARARIAGPRFAKLAADLRRAAADARSKLPLERVLFDLDRFPDDEPLIGNVPRSIYPWFDRMKLWQAGTGQNALAYALLEDKEAGLYAKGLLARLGRFPFWVHPWFEKRGQHIYYPVGELAMDVALAYDLCYDLLDEPERRTVREALRRNMIVPAHRSYVEDNLVTSNTSNWVAHVTGGSLMAQAATYGEGPENDPVEPFFTGVILKLDELIRKSVGRDGGYGESLGYCSFTMLSLSKVLPAAANALQIDLSGMLDRTYADLPYAGLLDDKLFFHFGDSSSGLGPMTNWAWLLPRTKDPLLAWLYDRLKKDETLMDVLYPNEDLPRRAPYDLPPGRLFRDLGTTVFRSGWKRDDFVFVFRTGAFYNHQHLDQGTFWLADRGLTFVEERHGSTYYDDPLYQSHYTQPVAHSTVLIDNHPQSQRTGDPLLFAPGFDDRAFVRSHLDGDSAAFVAGDIGRLYWGKVKGLVRNVLYLKPRTLLMLDTVVPAANDVDATLLYQTGRLAGIRAGTDVSVVDKGAAKLWIRHIAPAGARVEAAGTPLYIGTLKTEFPLEREGMLTVAARTTGRPLVIANMLETTTGKPPVVKVEPGDGAMSGTAGGRPFCFSTRPGEIYRSGAWETDALAMTWEDGSVFAAEATMLSRDGRLLVKSAAPMTFERKSGKLSFDLASVSAVTFAVEGPARNIRLNGRPAPGLRIDARAGTVTLTLPAGPGKLTWE
jgi:hypothetical protein